MNNINKTVFAFITAFLLSSSCVFATTQIPAPGYTESVNYNEGTNGTVRFYGNPNCTVGVGIPGSFTRDQAGRIVGIEGITDRQKIWELYKATIGN